ncbi:MAG: toll/interleukin-1 receptor domain-containing protein [Caldimonas sp.]
MTARVFISYRSSDGADKATALSRDLDALFGQEQIFLDKEDLPAGSRWRDEITRALDKAPILLVLVTPNYLGARDNDGERCIDREDDPVRDELAAAVAANAHVIPMMCDGVSETPAAATLPAPFDQLAERTWRRLRAYDWREDVARLGDDLRALGLVPRTTPAPLGSSPSPLLVDVVTAVQPSGIGRRLALLGGAVVLVGGGVAAWRWQEKKAASLAGRWRADIGRKGATTSRGGEIVNVTIEQNGGSLRVASSAVDIEQDPDWQKYRALSKERFGRPLDRVFYRGEGVLQRDEVVAPDAPVGPRRVLLSVHVDPPEGGDPIDTGALRGTVDADGKRIRARLWLNSEQGERIVDLRREP